MSLRAGAPAGGELGALSPAAVVRVLLLYACIWFVHGLLYHGRRHLRRVLARRTRARPITARQTTRGVVRGVAWLMLAYMLLLTMFELVELLRPAPPQRRRCLVCRSSARAARGKLPDENIEVYVFKIIPYNLN
ncbi:hypothetical protein MSG28_001850 [Choristoneura fumiferana]|uniref:Uncharacterized protein n=1 Tax=Choristoneura fumiferana TaxID=7141 RepID=A0ACC0KWA5_CHOFU|nr:hypothetical protein MSG28_001850 [Choristoneura fumiferana]